MKKMILTLIALLPFLFGCDSWEQTPYAEMYLEETEPLGKAGGVLHLHVYANYPWAMSTTEEKVTINPNSGPAETGAVVEITIPAVETDDMVTYYVKCYVASTSGKQFFEYPISIFQNYKNPDL